MQQADGVEFLVVGAERVGANQFGKRGGLVGRRHAQRAHLVKHHGKRARGDLPSCLRSGKSAADHVHRLKMRLRHGQKLFLSRAGDNAEAARRWRRVPRFGLPGYALFCRRAGSLALTSTRNGCPSERWLRKVLITALLTSANTNMAYGMNAVQKIVRNIIFVAGCLRMAKNERPQKRALRGFRSLRDGRYPTRCAGCPTA